VYNTKRPKAALVRKYADEGEPVLCTEECLSADFELVGANLISEKLAKTAKKDSQYRTLIRHDSEKLAKVILQLLN
jgi:hypothetical protein